MIGRCAAVRSGLLALCVCVLIGSLATRPGIVLGQATNEFVGKSVTLRPSGWLNPHWVNDGATDNEVTSPGGSQPVRMIVDLGATPLAINKVGWYLSTVAGDCGQTLAGYVRAADNVAGPWVTLVNVGPFTGPYMEWEFSNTTAYRFYDIASTSRVNNTCGVKVQELVGYAGPISTPTATETASSTATETATATATETASSTATETATATATATETASSTATETASSTATATGTASATATASTTATSAATATRTPSVATPAPSATRTPVSTPPPPEDPIRPPVCRSKKPCYVVASYSLGFNELGGVPVRVNLPVLEHDAVGSLLGGLVVLAMVTPHFYSAERVALGLGFVVSGLLVAGTGQWLWAGSFIVFAVACVLVRIQQVLMGMAGRDREG